MKIIAALYLTGTMLWGAWTAELPYRFLHLRPYMSGVLNLDASAGLWTAFALPGTILVHFLGWSPQSPLVTFASAAFWWAAWMIRKRFTRTEQPASSALAQAAPAELIGWTRRTRTYEEE